MREAVHVNYSITILMASNQPSFFKASNKIIIKTNIDEKIDRLYHPKCKINITSIFFFNEH